MKIIIGCERSGVIRRTLRNKNHDAWSCDLLPADDNSKFHIQDDVLDHLDENWDMAIFHPPCTFLCVTGNKWFYHPEDKHLPIEERRSHPKFPNRKQDRADAFEFFMALVNAPIKKICIENPVGVISSYWRKPDQIIQPFQFGHEEPKKTCLWLKHLPLLKPTKIVEPKYMISKSGKKLAEWYYKPSQSPERTKLRETTFQGIADAMAEQWGTTREDILV